MGCASSSTKGHDSDLAAMKAAGDTSDTKSKAAAAMLGKRAQHFQLYRDKFKSLDEVSTDLQTQGLSQARLIFAIDLTKANQWSGTRSFHGQSLHSLDPVTNPYKMVMTVLGRTLAPFDAEESIATFGFGDFVSQSKGLISFEPSGAPLQGVDNVVSAYDTVLRKAHLSGPANFAPVINKAVQLVNGSGGRYHVLCILAVGPMADEHMAETRDAVIAAAMYALSIVVIGIGDSHFDKLERFQSELPERPFNNFHFVRHGAVLRRAEDGQFDADRTDASLAAQVFMHTPDHFAELAALGYLGSAKKRQVKPIKVYSPFDLCTASSLKPLPTDAGSTKLDGEFISTSMHSANPLFAA